MIFLFMCIYRQIPQNKRHLASEVPFVYLTFKGETIRQQEE